MLLRAGRGNLENTRVDADLASGHSQRPGTETPSGIILACKNLSYLRLSGNPAWAVGPVGYTAEGVLKGPGLCISLLCSVWAPPAAW